MNIELRDYFAGLAMQSLLQRGWVDNGALRPYHETPHATDADLRELADAMIARREKEFARRS